MVCPQCEWPQETEEEVLAGKGMPLGYQSYKALLRAALSGSYRTLCQSEAGVICLPGSLGRSQQLTSSLMSWSASRQVGT